MTNLTKLALLTKVILSALTAIYILSEVVLALAPPISRDTLVHHLAIPKRYMKHGGIYEISSMVFFYYPMNVDIRYLIPLYFGNDIAPKFSHFGSGFF